MDSDLESEMFVDLFDAFLRSHAAALSQLQQSTSAGCGLQSEPDGVKRPGKSCAEMKNAPPASAPEPETKNAGKSKKKPKRAMLAYNFFVSQKWGELRKKKYPDLDHIAAAKQLGIMWKEASDAEKAPFEAMAKKDKTRYEKEKEPAAAAASKIAPPESAPETETVGKSKKKPKKDKDENKPKRCKSAYLFFCDDKRSQLKEENPELSMIEMSKQLGIM